MMSAVDKADAARFVKEEVLNPSGWVLLNFIMDPRTGLGRYRDFKISNFDLMKKLIDSCRTHQVDEILALPDVQERIEIYFQHEEPATEQIRRCSTVHGNLVLLDLRDEKTIYACNRFMVYALHPECNVSIHAIWGREAQNTVYAIGNSIFNRTQPVNIGELCLKYGGGGHADAGTLQVEHADGERVLGELMATLAPEEEAVVLEATDEDEMLTLDDDHTVAENFLQDVIEETGMGLLPTKQDMREIHERLDRIERMIAEIGTPTTH
jgi:nanoRNase/pAp phosphatase (c-di-AMP/oligoRNAs hydrolase)